MNDREWPLVTVFTLVYNTGKYVIEALESVKANDYPNLQHIIIDDCSTDGESVELVETWIMENNYSCRFIKHEVNQGICKSLNEIFYLAKGKYALGISDDLITSTRITDHVALFESQPENVAIVYGDVALINGRGEITVPSAFTNINHQLGRVPDGEVYYDLLKYNFIPGVGVTMRVSCVKEVGNFDESLFFEDWDMWLRLSRKFKFKRDDRRCGYYRRYTESVWSKLNVKNVECCLQTIDKNISDHISRSTSARFYYNYSEYYYKLKGRKPYKYFYRALKLRWNYKAFIFALTSFLGIPYSFLFKRN